MKNNLTNQFHIYFDNLYVVEHPAIPTNCFFLSLHLLQ